VWVMCAATEIESQPSLRVRESERGERKVVTELSCTREPRADGLAHRGLCLQMRAATNADIATAAD
jgi:hypothetical protein